MPSRTKLIDGGRCQLTIDENIKEWRFNLIQEALERRMENMRTPGVGGREDLINCSVIHITKIMNHKLVNSRNNQGGIGQIVNWWKTNTAVGYMFDRKAMVAIVDVYEDQQMATKIVEGAWFQIEYDSEHKWKAGGQLTSGRNRDQLEGRA